MNVDLNSNLSLFSMPNEIESALGKGLGLQTTNPSSFLNLLQGSLNTDLQSLSMPVGEAVIAPNMPPLDPLLLLPDFVAPEPLSLPKILDQSALSIANGEEIIASAPSYFSPMSSSLTEIADEDSLVPELVKLENPKLRKKLGPLTKELSPNVISEGFLPKTEIHPSKLEDFVSSTKLSGVDSFKNENLIATKASPKKEIPNGLPNATAPIIPQANVTEIFKSDPLALLSSELSAPKISSELLVPNLDTDKIIQRLKAPLETLDFSNDQIALNFIPKDIIRPEETLQGTENAEPFIPLETKLPMPLVKIQNAVTVKLDNTDALISIFQDNKKPIDVIPALPIPKEIPSLPPIAPAPREQNILTIATPKLATPKLATPKIAAPKLATPTKLAAPILADLKAPRVLNEDFSLNQVTQEIEEITSLPFSASSKISTFTQSFATPEELIGQSKTDSESQTDDQQKQNDGDQSLNFMAGNNLTGLTQPKMELTHKNHFQKELMESAHSLKDRFKQEQNLDELKKGKATLDLKEYGLGSIEIVFESRFSDNSIGMKLIIEKDDVLNDIQNHQMAELQAKLNDVGIKITQVESKANANMSESYLESYKFGQGSFFQNQQQSQQQADRKPQIYQEHQNVNPRKLNSVSSTIEQVEYAPNSTISVRI